MKPNDYEDERTQQLRAEARATPAGQLLWRMGMDYWDTESSARRVAEFAAEEIASLAAERAELIASLAELMEQQNERDKYQPLVSAQKTATELLKRLKP